MDEPSEGLPALAKKSEDYITEVVEPRSLDLVAELDELNREKEAVLSKEFLLWSVN